MSKVTVNELQLLIFGLSAISFGVSQTMRFAKAACLQSEHVHRFHRDVDINDAVDREADSVMEFYAVLQPPNGATSSSSAPQLPRDSPAPLTAGKFTRPAAAPQRRVGD